MIGSIDRIEEGLITVVFDDLSTKIFSQDSYPQLKVGDIVVLANQRLRKDNTETALRKKRIIALTRKIQRKADTKNEKNT